MRSEVGVDVGAGVSVIMIGAKIFVAIGSVAEGAIVGIPSMGVGVWYSPHNDAVPMQDVRIELASRKIKTRFTVWIIPASSLKSRRLTIV